MKKILLYCYFLLLGLPASAEVETAAEAVAKVQPVVAQTSEEPAADLETPATTEEQPFETIIHKVEKEIIPLPSCNDDKLLEQTKEFLVSYYAKSNNQGVMFRRRRHFVLNALNDLKQENIANYKTQQARPISDIIVNLKMNKNIIEENMLLCKKELADNSKSALYLLVYPEEEGYRVYVVNLDPKHETGLENNFIYKK